MHIDGQVIDTTIHVSRSDYNNKIYKEEVYPSYSGNHGSNYIN